MNETVIVNLVGIVLILMTSGAFALWLRKDTGIAENCMLIFCVIVTLTWSFEGESIVSSFSRTSPDESNSVTTETTNVLDQNDSVIINGVRYYPYQPADN